MKVLLLHAYSADNRGDGLLVEESVRLVREAVGRPCTFTLAAARPETFAGLATTALRTSRGGGTVPHIVPALWRERPDLVVAVGGGYLRGGAPVELVKACLVHGPQLLYAATRSVPVVYLPQSIGPFPPFVAGAVRRLLRRTSLVLVRDDRSAALLGPALARRAPDLALLGPWVARIPARRPHPVPVLTARALARGAGGDLRDLAARLGLFDGFVQSRTGGNDDTAVMRSLGPRRLLTAEELLCPTGRRRVVVAVRLHAALMALAAGHHVVHLAYERKGFGAFDDLDLADHVHNVFDLDPDLVLRQVTDLLEDDSARLSYDDRVCAAREELGRRRTRLVADVAGLVDARPRPALQC